MEIIKAYKASDGSVHLTESLCKERELEWEAECQFNDLWNQKAVYGELKIDCINDLMEIVKDYPELFKHLLKGE